MRQSDGRRLIRYLLSGWVIGVCTLAGMMLITHKTLHHEDWIVIVSTACIMGGVFYHMYDFWKYGECKKERNRGTPG